jgi:glutathione S-transferase
MCGSIFHISLYILERVSMLFISLDYSPWSEKARWALDHFSHNYKPVNYFPVLGGFWLRMKTKAYKEKVTVPVLITESTILSDSLCIAKYADAHRRPGEKTIFPDKDSVMKWNQISERALLIGRYLAILRQYDSPKALEEILPPIIPTSLRCYFRWLSRLGLNYHRSKYGVDLSEKELISELRFYLHALRLELSDKVFILDDFSYADITMAVVLQYVKPRKDLYSAQGPASSQCWANEELKNEFIDLIEWRDSLYQRHRVNPYRMGSRSVQTW